MMGPRQEAQPALFYEFSLEDHIPQNHLLRRSQTGCDTVIGSKGSEGAFLTVVSDSVC